MPENYAFYEDLHEQQIDFFPVMIIVVKMFWKSRIP